MSLRPSELRVNHLVTPLGIGTANPEFSWKLLVEDASIGVDTAVSAFALQVSTSPAFEPHTLQWDTGRSSITPESGFKALYGGASPLQSKTRYYWRVRVWGHQDAGDSSAGMDHGNWSASEQSWFEMGLLEQTAWKASWISAPETGYSGDKSTIYLTGRLKLSGDPVRARAYATACGWYKLFINGVSVAGNALVPRWTPFDHYTEYQAYDITSFLKSGENVVSVAVADGRFRGQIGITEGRARYGNRLAALVQVEADTVSDGHVLLCSDETWTSHSGHVSESDPMYGETADLRISDSDWLSGVDNPETQGSPSEPRTCDIVAVSTKSLIAEEAERVDEVMRLPCKSVRRSHSGAHILDFGQNLTGIVRIRLRGSVGTSVSITYSEVLTSEGELDLHYLLPFWFLKTPPQRDSITLSGEDTVFQPWFSIYGFRYVEVKGLDYDLELTDVEGIVLSTKANQVGSFTCSDERLERFHKNVLWSMRGNFTDTATDCPTRERMGWTGDVQVFAPTATTLIDSRAFLRRYLRNLAAEQRTDGAIPPYIPSGASQFSSGLGLFASLMAGAVGWGDAGVMVPWTLYTSYGDTDVLAAQYDSMKLWVDSLATRARKYQSWRRWIFGGLADGLEHYILDTGYHWGEWLRASESSFQMVYNFLFPSAAIPTAYMAHSAQLLSEICKVLGKEQESTNYLKLFTQTRKAWRAAFVRDGGARIAQDYQDDYVRGLMFDLLVTEEEKATATRRLVELIEATGDHLATGFLSTGLLLPALANHGRADVAYRLLLQNTVPSWLYPVQEKGATTVWETWHGYYDDKNRGDSKACWSHNHYALGAAARWLQEGVAGLSAASPGYRRIRVRPFIGGGLTHAAYSMVTPFGIARSSWRKLGEGDDGRVRLEVIVPPGTTAEVFLGNSTTQFISSGSHVFEYD